MGAGGGRDFDRVADEYDATRGGEQRGRDVVADDLAPHLPVGDVLEIGVGTGVVAQALREQAPQLRHVAGVDLSAGMLRRAHERLPGQVLRASAQSLPFPDEVFDAVVAVHVLHLVDDLTATLAEAARVLRPGGRLVAVHGEPNQPDDDELNGLMFGMRGVGPGRQDSPDAVRALAGGTGFRCREQRPATPRTSWRSPVEMVELIRSRTWSRLWDLDEDQWREQVEPVIAGLLALPDPDRPREQTSWMTVSVLERR